MPTGPDFEAMSLKEQVSTLRRAYDELERDWNYYKPVRMARRLEQADDDIRDALDYLSGGISGAKVDRAIALLNKVLSDLEEVQPKPA